MGILSHPLPELQSDYRRSDIAPGAALAVTSHLAFCATCANAFEDFGDRPPTEPYHEGGWIPSALAEAPRDAWTDVAPGLRRSEVRQVSGIAESVHIIELASGFSLHLPPGAEFLLILSGTLRDGDVTYSTGDFLHIEHDEIKGARVGDQGSLCLVVGDDRLTDHATWIS